MFSSLTSLGGVIKKSNNSVILTTQYPPFTTSLTGGDVTYSGNVYVLTFKTDGTLTFNNTAQLPTIVNYLLVGGGGSGSVGPSISTKNPGGGGAGGSILQLQAGGGGVIPVADLTKTFTFTVATSVAGPYIANTYSLSGNNGNPTSLIITNGGTFNAPGGNGGNAGGTGGVGTGGGQLIAGGNGGNAPSGNGGNGSTVTIRSVSYYFGGGGSGGNNGDNPIGGLGGGGGAGNGSNGNGGVIYYRPDGTSQLGGATGFANSGGGGAGCNSTNNFSARAGGSGIAVVWFTYP